MQDQFHNYTLWLILDRLNHKPYKIKMILPTSKNEFTSLMLHGKTLLKCKITQVLNLDFQLTQ